MDSLREILRDQGKIVIAIVAIVALGLLAGKAIDILYRDARQSAPNEMVDALRKIQVELTPPRWVNIDGVVREWAMIAHCRVVSIHHDGPTVMVLVEGTSDDVKVFERILDLNTAKW